MNTFEIILTDGKKVILSNGENNTTLCTLFTENNEEMGTMHWKNDAIADFLFCEEE